MMYSWIHGQTGDIHYLQISLWICVYILLSANIDDFSYFIWHMIIFKNGYINANISLLMDLYGYQNDWS